MSDILNVPEDSREQLDQQPDALQDQPAYGRGVPEILLILVLFFVAHGDLPPDVNEAHYLGKAKHYWNPDWCPSDHFLQSADTHLVFYWSVGWLTKWLPLAVVAWIGRLAAWGLLATGWFRLTRALIPRAGSGLLTAAFYLLLLDRAQLAGEWVVGGLEAKGIAYGFVLLAMEALVCNRWRRVWIFLGLASAFHVLVGGWATLAVSFAWLVAPADRCKLREMFPFVILGGCLALPNLVPALLLTSGASASEIAAANDIYVYQRLPHHLLITTFPVRHVISYLVVLIGWLALLVVDRQKWDGAYRRLASIVMGAVLIGVVGLLLTLVLPQPGSVAASLLRFYWFRLADALLPIGLIFAIARVISQWSVAGPRVARWAVALLIVGASGYVVTDFMQRRADPRPPADRQSLPRARAGAAVTRQIYLDWVNACQWIRTETPVDATFMTPRRQQTFKWYAHRGEVVCWKDVPQDAQGLIQWQQRVQDLFAGQVIPTGFASLDREQLIALMRKYDARYIVRPRFQTSPRLPLKRIYPVGNQRSYYEVYEWSR